MRTAKRRCYRRKRAQKQQKKDHSTAQTKKDHNSGERAWALLRLGYLTVLQPSKLTLICRCGTKIKKHHFSRPAHACDVHACMQHTVTCSTHIQAGHESSSPIKEPIKETKQGSPWAHNAADASTPAGTHAGGPRTCRPAQAGGQKRAIKDQNKCPNRAPTNWHSRMWLNVQQTHTAAWHGMACKKTCDLCMYQRLYIHSPDTVQPTCPVNGSNQ